MTFEPSIQRSVLDLLNTDSIFHTADLGLQFGDFLSHSLYGMEDSTARVLRPVIVKFSDVDAPSISIENPRNMIWAMERDPALTA